MTYRTHRGSDVGRWEQLEGIGRDVEKKAGGGEPRDQQPEPQVPRQVEPAATIHR